MPPHIVEGEPLARRLREHVLAGAHLDQSAVVQKRHVIGQAVGLLDQVGDEDDRNRGLQFDQHVLEVGSCKHMFSETPRERLTFDYVRGHFG